MTIPKPVQAVIDFVLALPSALDKDPAPSVRALSRCPYRFEFSGLRCDHPEGHAGGHIGTYPYPNVALSFPQSANGESPSFTIEYPEERQKQRREFKQSIQYFDESWDRLKSVCENKQRSRICNMRWANTTVLLGETDFIRCRFFNCKLIVDGPFSMECCATENCTIQSKEPYENASTSARSRR